MSHVAGADPGTELSWSEDWESQVGVSYTVTQTTAVQVPTIDTGSTILYLALPCTFSSSFIVDHSNFFCQILIYRNYHKQHCIVVVKEIKIMICLQSFKQKLSKMNWCYIQCSISRFRASFYKFFTCLNMQIKLRFLFSSKLVFIFFHVNYKTVLNYAEFVFSQIL